MTGLRRLDEFTFYPTLAETPGASLVLFTAPTCGSCKVYRRALEMLDGPDDPPVFEVDAGHSMALTREYEVFHLPGLFLFRDGEFHCALEAQPLPGALRRAVDAALRMPAAEAP